MVSFTDSEYVTQVVKKAVDALPEEVRKVLYLSVLKLSGTDQPLYAGHNDTTFVYPASIYKLYVAMGVLHAVSRGRLALETVIRVGAPNVIDEVKEVESDPRPLLRVGSVATAGHLLDLMITRSDNTAANVLIDIAARGKINAQVRAYGWSGSEVTRKFLPRNKEDEVYRDAPATVTTTRHLTEFLYLVEKEQLVKATCSHYLKNLLRKQLDKTKLAAGLPPSAEFAHKTGWYETNRNGEIVGITGDCGIVTDGEKKYIISAIVVRPGLVGKLILAQVGRAVHEWM